MRVVDQHLEDLVVVSADDAAGRVSPPDASEFFGVADDARPAPNGELRSVRAGQSMQVEERIGLEFPALRRGPDE